MLNNINNTRIILIIFKNYNSYSQWLLAFQAFYCMFIYLSLIKSVIMLVYIFLLLNHMFRYKGKKFIWLKLSSQKGSFIREEDVVSYYLDY
ncbi:hypothetical protein NF27_GJ00020 [Candidatus Jidaibacter acanthamoeba]|uniref:Uncharacterized protein n=1 Tax=Candidatus Jidaibacter acanthamoebae TaxID=86105 RepID=A0A0C1MRK9_9RICK|nr:hypothetical protein NF27_GJ00020 [Candidatus Jidaibacter acanthamoeba]